ncbi:glycosyltransferase [Chromohalobacter japonicus]|nr:glycosyltransferase [Chromohalobacter japonicus]
MAEESAPVPDGEYLINVGTFEARKRHDRLLRAYKASGVTTPLVLLGKGKGDEEANLRAMIEDMGLAERVILPGYQTNPYPFIRNAKALILTSDAEGLPRALIESLLLDTPVVSVDCPSGPREILSGELADFLVPLEDETALADAIARMDANPVRVTEAHYRPFLKETVLPQFEALAK